MVSTVSLSPQALAPLIGRSAGAGNAELSDDQQAQVQELKQRDAEVRRHEQAHVRAGGSLTGMPSYEYTQGPDGRRYAVNGEVSIDTSPARDPEATIRKMEVVIRAALAPADPSAQDRAVAAEARQAKADAQAELHAEQRAEQENASQASDGAVGSTAISAAATDRALALYRQAAAYGGDPFELDGKRSSASVIA